MANELRKLDQLWIAEKPSNQAVIETALRALGAQWVNAASSRSDGYTLLQWQGKVVAVTAYFGHMIEMLPPKAYPDYQQYVATSKEIGRRDFFDYLPFFPDEYLYAAKPERKRDGTVVTRNGQPVESERLKVVESLIRKATETINACDIDREGQLIFDEVIIRRLAGDPGLPRFKRLRISSTEDNDMILSVQALEPNGSEQWVNVRSAAMTREVSDYLLGMNLSMAMQSLIVRERGAPALGLGRVKIAITVLVAQRDHEIDTFVPYSAYVPVASLGDRTQLRWFKREGAPDQAGFNEKGQLVDKVLADRIVADLARGMPGVITKATVEEKGDGPPLPYSMGSLLVDATKKLGLSAQEVQELAQKLYEKHKLITYVGTDCSHLPESMHARGPEILAALRGVTDVVPGLDKALDAATPTYKSAAFNDSKVDEHFGIVPTGATPHGLTDTEAALYGMVVNRYVAQFMGPYTYLSTVLTVKFGNDVFRALARKPTRLGWRAVPGYMIDEAEGVDASVDVSRFHEGQSVQAVGARLDSKKVGPPPAFDQSTLAEAMIEAHRYVRDDDYPTKQAAIEVRDILKETQGIGTSRTRSAAITDVIKMGLIIEEGSGKNRFLHVSATGRQVLSLLPPNLTNIAVTAQWELLFLLVARGQIRGSDVIAQQKQLIRHAVHHLAAQHRSQRR